MAAGFVLLVVFRLVAWYSCPAPDHSWCGKAIDPTLLWNPEGQAPSTADVSTWDLCFRVAANRSWGVNFWVLQLSNDQPIIGISAHLCLWTHPCSNHHIVVVSLLLLDIIPYYITITLFFGYHYYSLLLLVIVGCWLLFPIISYYSLLTITIPYKPFRNHQFWWDHEFTSNHH